MVGIMSSIPSGGNFIFADFETSRCQFCTKMPEMSDLCYLGKTRVALSLSHYSSILPQLLAYKTAFTGAFKLILFLCFPATSSSLSDYISVCMDVQIQKKNIPEM